MTNRGKYGEFLQSQFDIINKMYDLLSEVYINFLKNKDTMEKIRSILDHIDRMRDENE